MPYRAFARLALAVLGYAATAAAAPDDVARPSPVPSLLWVSTQLVPSPEVAWGDGAAHGGLRWQVTPLLYSWGVNRRVSGFRAFVVEPFVRQSGSIEAFVSPEVLWLDAASFLLRPGVRAYFPVLERGEGLSVSAGAAYQRIAGRDAVALEVGAYVLFGIVGLQLSHAPGPVTPAQSIATLRLRYF